MSAHKQAAKDQGLPLPSPRSPAELDEKILAYARAHAPGKRSPVSPLQPAWIAGLATTGVIVLALFITVAQQPVPSVAPTASEPALMSSPAADADRVQAVAKKADQEKTAAPAARTDLPSRQMSRAQMPELELREEQAMADEAFTRRASKAPDSAAAPPLEALSLDAAAAAGAAPTPTELQLQLQLQHYAALLQQGREAEARAAYQALREGCTDCRLPATLEQALAAYPQPQQP